MLSLQTKRAIYLTKTPFQLQCKLHDRLFELFCLQNSLIVGMQLQVSGKVGSLVGWFLGGPCSAFPMTVEFYRKASCRGRNENEEENARKIPLLKPHDESVRILIA